MQRRTSATVIGFALGLAFVGGCDSRFFPNVDVEVPATVQAVLDALDAYAAAADGPLATVEPGTVMDDLASLDGCWASVYKRDVLGVGYGFFTVYRFNAADRTFTRWSGVGTEAGQLLPVLPLLSVETGTFAVQSSSVLRFTNERYFCNLDPITGQVTSELREQPAPSTTVTRLALVSLAGDQMLLYIDAETTADIDPLAERPFFRRLECR